MTQNHLDNVVLAINSVDIDRTTSLTSKDELISENGAPSDINGPINPQINIENSSDIIIGPVTQLIGPVTIYQHVNGSQLQLTGDNVDQINKEAKVVEKLPLDTNPSLNKRKFTSKTIIIICTSIFIICILLVVIIAILLASKRNDRTDVPINIDVPRLSTSPPAELLGHHQLLDRSQWGGRPPKSIRPLVHPTNLVIISHTASDPCWNTTVCALKVQSFQSYHVGSLHSPDIGYNFLIGGDRNIYVGRGWDAQNFHQNNSIGISFIGNYIFDELSADMIDAAKMLIERGVVMGKLDDNYKLVAHNQTYATESPGSNVYSIIKTWPHFDNGTFYR